MSQVDGRILRSQKSQSIILDAIIKLINSGNYYPTAEEVAKKAIKVAADICVFTNDNVKIEKI